MESLLRTDLAHERLLQPFLDRLYRANEIDVFRFDDRLHQRQGIDVMLEKDGYRFAVDEKAQLHYIGRSLQTFALEIDLVLDGQVRPGWLFNEHKTTEVYSFVFDIRLKGGATVFVHPDQVESAHVVLVNRERLIKGLAQAGLTRAVLGLFSRELRAGKADSSALKSPAAKLKRSDALAERPVNLLVERAFLSSIGQTLKQQVCAEADATS